MFKMLIIRPILYENRKNEKSVDHEASSLQKVRNLRLMIKQLEPRKSTISAEDKAHIKGVLLYM